MVFIRPLLRGEIGLRNDGSHCMVHAFARDRYYAMAEADVGERRLHILAVRCQYLDVAHATGQLSR
jgi:hypothetical protein